MYAYIHHSPPQQCECAWLGILFRGKIRFFFRNRKTIYNFFCFSGTFFNNNRAKNINFP